VTAPAELLVQRPGPQEQPWAVVRRDHSSSEKDWSVAVYLGDSMEGQQALSSPLKEALLMLVASIPLSEWCHLSLLEPRSSQGEAA
jgi:hypothetical protein